MKAPCKHPRRFHVRVLDVPPCIWCRRCGALKQHTWQAGKSSYHLGTWQLPTDRQRYHLTKTRA